MPTPTTMFHFSFISDVRAALFLNVLKTLKLLSNAETTCFKVLFHFYCTNVSVSNKTILFPFISHVRAA